MSDADIADELQAVQEEAWSEAYRLCNLDRVRILAELQQTQAWFREAESHTGYWRNREQKRTAALTAELQQVKDAYRDKRTEAEYHANDVEALRTENERYRGALEAIRDNVFLVEGPDGKPRARPMWEIADTALAPTTQEDRQ